MPLFPFVWQYSNQPIEQLAADIAELSVNTAEYIPVSTGTSLTDSPLKVEQVLPGIFGVRSYFNGVQDGIQLVPGKYEFGATSIAAGAGNNTRVDVMDVSGLAYFRTNAGGGYTDFGIFGGSLYGSGITDATAGGAAGLYVKIRLNNVPYKIALLDA
jgi:hypothetical protein